MNPVYKFYLSDGTSTRTVQPIYKDGLSIDYTQEQGQQFFRGKLNGKLTFQKDDFTFIASKPFDTEFDIRLSISYDNGVNWSPYWRGCFWKTDCAFNEDDETAVVTPVVRDVYNNILSGLGKEFNLLDLAPAIQPVKMDKRPMIQVYVPGQNVIGCFLSGMWWEQECEVVNNLNELEEIYKFSPSKTFLVAERTETISAISPELPEVFFNDTGYSPIISGDFRVEVSAYVRIFRTSDNTELWRSDPFSTIPQEVMMAPVAGSGAQGTFKMFVRRPQVYCRLVTDVESALGLNTSPIPDNDLVENNRNYKYVIGYDLANTIFMSDQLSASPTKWGIYQPGRYYVMYTEPGITRTFPIARAGWGRTSLWFAFSRYDEYIETAFRKEYVLKDTYPLWSVISVLLGKVAPELRFSGTQPYSEFLYPSGTNPLTGIDQRLFITPKSNLIASGYDQPAQKAPVTLGRIFDMLRDCFRCFWFIDNTYRLRIEHISWFMRGGTYTPGQTVIGMDLTQQVVSRNGKPWSYARNQYKFDKPEMAARYQFGWMDDVTELFEGYPIDIISKYVNPDNIEHIEVSQFTADVDYILLNPGEVSKDGFTLLAAKPDDGEFKLPYVYIGGSSLQNGWAAFAYLQYYYMYDMPAYELEVDGVRRRAYGIKKLKIQNIKFPVMTEPNFLQLIKTGLGEGIIQKMSVNLSSRNADTTLAYDTE